MLVESFAAQYERLHVNLIEVLDLIPEDKLYWKPFENPSFVRVYSCGELLSHIGGSIEYTFNGIMSNFWEEPFEWITREALPTGAHIAGYLGETAELRREALAGIGDRDLPKLIHLPDATQATIADLLLSTLTHATHHRGQVYAYVHLFSDRRLPSISAPRNLPDPNSLIDEGNTS